LIKETTQQVSYVHSSDCQSFSRTDKNLCARVAYGTEVLHGFGHIMEKIQTKRFF